LGFVFFSSCTVPNTVLKAYVLLNECFSLLCYEDCLVSWRCDVKEMNRFEIEKQHAPFKENRI